MNGPKDITRIMNEAGSGDRESLRLLFDLIHRDLRRIAGEVRGGKKISLQSTELVGEAYLELLKTDFTVDGRERFYGLAATIMHRKLAEYFRRKKAQARGGNAQQIPLEERDHPTDDSTEQSLQLLRALDELEQQQPVLARIFYLCEYLGYRPDEISADLGLAPSTIARDRKMAKLWLKQKLESGRG